jgi:CHAD domain-containing protein
VKARRVRRLDPEMPLADAAERILRVRLDELYSFVPRALEPEETRALHDMRIAAKRLRYLLELTAFCFGAYAATGAKRAKQLQDLIGEIHDCDVMLPLVRDQLTALRAADAEEVRRAAGDAEDLDAALAARAPHRAEYRGLEVLLVHLQSRRELLFARFLERWEALQRQGFRARLEHALGERAAARGTPAALVERATRRPRALAARE